MDDADNRLEIKENGKRDKYFTLLLNNKKKKKDREQKSDGGANCIWSTWNDFQRLGKEAGKVGNQRASRDNLNYSNTKLGQNTDCCHSDSSERQSTSASLKNSKIIITTDGLAQTRIRQRTWEAIWYMHHTFFDRSWPLRYKCNIMAEGFRFIYLAFGFS